MNGTSRVALFLAGVASTLALSGCATVVGGKRQVLPLDSDPPEATATWSGQRVVTPGALVVPRKTEGIRIRFEKPGFAACAVTLEREKRGSYWINLALIPAGIVAGGAIGNAAHEPDHWFDFSGVALGAALGGVILPLGAMGLDKGSGAAYEQRPEKVTVALAPAREGAEDALPGAEPACAVARKATTRSDRPSTPTAGFMPGTSTSGVRVSW